MVRFFSIAVLVCALSIIIALPAMAGEGDVCAVGSLVLKIRAEAGGQTVAERAGVVTDRIRELMLGLDPFRSEELAVTQVFGGQTCIYYGHDLVVTVDEGTARTNGCTTRQLAEVWVARLKDIIPGVKATMMMH